MRQLHNELIASPDYGGLNGSRHANTNDVIISDTMIRSLEPPRLRLMTYHHKIMCGCSICNNLKYSQDLLNAWQRKKLKIMKDKAYNSLGRGKHELTQAYKSYAYYAFPNNETCCPRCKNAEDSVICTLTNYECQFPNWKCVLQKCTACTSIDIPGVKMDSSK